MKKLLNSIPLYMASLLTALLTTAVTSCSNTEHASGRAADTTIWDCRSIQSSAYHINNDFPDSRILLLEDNGTSTVGRINKLILADSLLFAADSYMARQIFVFNSNTGKAIRSMGHKGKGPDEYIILNDVSYDPANNLLYALCDRNKLIVFNSEGEIEKVSAVPFKSEYLEYDDGHFYFFGNDENTGELTVTDTDMNVIASYFPNRGNPLQHMLLHPIQKSPDGGITYTRYMDNNIYQLHYPDSITVKYKVDFGPNGYGREEAERDGEDNIHRNLAHRRGRIKYFAETDRFATILFFNNNEPCMSVLDKQTGQSVTSHISSVSDDNLGILQSPLEYATGNSLIQVIDAAALPEDMVKRHSLAMVENPIIYFLAHK